MVAELDAAMTDSVTALAFSTVSDEEIRQELQRTECAFIDLFGSHLDTVERVLHVNATHSVAALHGVGDTLRYDRRMKAIEFAMEHDDGASLRNLEQADLILVAPSRCGKTPDLDVPRAPARAQGRELPARPRGLRLRATSRAPSRTSATSASACCPPPPGSARCAGSADPGRPMPASPSAATSCAGPRRSTAPTASPRSTPPRCPWRRWRPSSCRAAACPTSADRRADERNAVTGTQTGNDAGNDGTDTPSSPVDQRATSPGSPTSDSTTSSASGARTPRSARWCSTCPSRGRAGARRLRDDGRRLPALPRPRGPGRPHQRDPRRPRRRGHPGARRSPVPRSASPVEQQPFPADLETRDPHGIRTPRRRQRATR